MSIRYFKKSVPSNVLFTEKGQPIKFEAYPDGFGVGSFDTATDTDVLAKLDSCIKARIGGVTELDEKGYEELKKKLASSPSVSPLKKEIIRIAPMTAPNANPALTQPVGSVRVKDVAPVAEAVSAPSAAAQAVSDIPPMVLGGVQVPEVGKGRKIAKVRTGVPKSLEPPPASSEPESLI